MKIDAGYEFEVGRTKVRHLQRHLRRRLLGFGGPDGGLEFLEGLEFLLGLSGFALFAVEGGESEVGLGG